jgi:hypothetical protein
MYVGRSNRSLKIYLCTPPPSHFHNRLTLYSQSCQACHAVTPLSVSWYFSFYSSTDCPISEYRSVSHLGSRGCSIYLSTLGGENGMRETRGGVDGSSLHSDDICLSDFLFAQIVTPYPPLPPLNKLRVATHQLRNEPPAQNAKKLDKKLSLHQKSLLS